ncbi:Fic/DOC family protein [Bradyrhizobium hereditatis]|uniref:Fic/DOC family protein n=1 Tax=Bradyrhizobium hereditatis TaxID=2821405 RepID=UPI001CE289B7|nr:Fic family protein [Bradyrhizobium hereditatis]
MRNFEKEKDLAIVKRAEHASFMTGLDEAFAALAVARTLSFEDVLKTHGILFGAVYPWAGQDRTRTAPKLTIKKGPVIFANAPEIRAAVEFALRKGQDKDYMKAKPGEIMGYFAYAHPFLDGNGRTIMTVHSVLAQRASFSIDWSATKKDAYLDALTKEIENPSKGHLDAYLKQFMRDPIAYEQLATAIVQAPGLDGSVQNTELNEVLGMVDEPAVKARYEAMLAKRTKT